MPKWRECRMGDLLEIKHGFAFLGEYFGSSGTHVVLTPGNFLEEGGFKEKADKAKWYSGPIPDEYVLNEGDLIVAMTEQAEGLLGSSALIPRSGLYLHNQRLGLVQIRDRDQADQHFLYYLFNSKPVRQQIRGSASGTKIRHTAPSRIAEVKVRVPPLPVQRRIAGILSAYDELMENSQRRIRILEAMARALYREWFVEFHYPGNGHEKLIELETGPAPARWKTGRLDSFVDVLETGNRPKGGVADITEGVPSIGAESILGVGQFDYSKTKYVPQKYFDSMKSGIVQDRDVLVYKDGGRPGVFIPHITLFGSGFPFEKMAINSHVYRVRAKSSISQEYLYFYLSSEAVLHWMHMHGSGAAIPSLAREDLKQLPFVQPDAPTLEKFDRFVQPLVTQILALARQIQNLRRTRDLLLPRLLSGQVILQTN